MKRSRPFGSRLLRRNLSIVSLAFCAVAIIWIYNSYKQSQYALIQRLSVEAQLIAETIGPAIRFNDAEAQQNLLTTLQVDPAISLVNLNHNDVIHHVFNKHREGRHQRLSIPVLEAGETLATIEIHYTDRDLYAQLGEQVAYVMSILGLAVLLISLLTKALIDRASKPFQDMVAMVRMIVKDKNYSLRIPYDGNDQVGDICRDMNIMFEMIERRDKDLEQRVKSRTLALTKANKELEYLSFHDPITNLPNRRKFNSTLESLTASEELRTVNHGLVVLDLDQFKTINDTCGHIAGDALLLLVANTMTNLVTKPDVVARLGGDEFAVVLHQQSLAKLKLFSERLRQKLEAMVFHWEGDNFRISASIGACLINWPAETAEALFQKADAACYAAKEGGRNQVVVLGENTTALKQRKTQMQWVHKVNEAIDTDGFSLFGQRIQPLSNRLEPEMVEVLLRLNPDNSLPSVFIPATDRYGITSKIDHWVVSELLSQLQRHGLQNRRYWVNLSGQSISNPEFMNFLEHNVRRADFPAYSINFEITETAAVKNVLATQQAITRIKALGCHFSLDDFGSGMSSYSYLRSFEVDFIKVDGAFMNNLASDPINQIFVKSILEMAQALNVQTVAECLESPTALELVRELGADYGQGYTIQRPQPLF